MARVTLAEIARRAGVSTGAASYALNGRPGVSDATRARVQAVAAELRWEPSSAARMLSGGRADSIGLVLPRSASTLATEPYFMELIAGLERVFTLRGCALLLQVVLDVETEIACHERWAAQARVDGVVVVDLRADDPRLAALRSLGLPAVLAGDPSLGDGLPAVYNDDAAAAAAVVDHLVGLGHRRIARVAGPAALGHVGIRAAAAAAAARSHGVDLEIVHTDFTGRAGAGATTVMLEGPAGQRPTAIVYDNDIMAVAGLSVARSLHLDVPGDVSLVAGDDSPLCEVTHPTLSAVGHDVVAYGSLIAEKLFAVLDGEEVGHVLATTPTLTLRESVRVAPTT